MLPISPTIGSRLRDTRPQKPDARAKPLFRRIERTQQWRDRKKHRSAPQDNRCSPYLPPSDRVSAIRDLKNQMRGPNRFSDVLSVRNNGVLRSEEHTSEL